MGELAREINPLAAKPVPAPPDALLSSRSFPEREHDR
jgi:hypothetical protein